jgi:HSP20 family protein
VYGLSIRTGIGGIPRVEHFGNIRTGDKGPMVAEVREPLVDVFDEEHEIVVAAELPGVAEDEIELEVRDDIVCLETTGEYKYAKDILLPNAVKTTELEKTYRNGILEVRLKKA